MKDPTAKAASRNVEGERRAAFLMFRNVDGNNERLWLDPATFRILSALTRTFRSDDGERHIRFNEEAAALLEQRDGQSPTKGNLS